MVSMDIRLQSEEINALRSLVGKELISIQHDAFTYTDSSSQIIQINAENGTFYLYSFTEPLDYFGAEEDVAVWSFETERYKAVDRKKFTETPIRRTIKGISLVQENQRLYENGAQIYDIWLTRGIIIELGDCQLSFEKAVWFSEEIYIQEGHDLIRKFASIDEFVKSDWEESIVAECSREIIALK